MLVRTSGLTTFERGGIIQTLTDAAPRNPQLACPILINLLNVPKDLSAAEQPFGLIGHLDVCNQWLANEPEPC